MSDPNFWTPPCSPKFGGGNGGFIDDLGCDLFMEAEDDAQSMSSLLGISCNMFSEGEILSFFEHFLGTDIADESLNYANSVWSRLLLISEKSTDIPFTNYRNDISILLAAAFHDFRNIDQNKLCSLFNGLRSLLLHLGCMTSCQNTSVHLFHLQLELWIVFMKLLDLILMQRMLPAANTAFCLNATNGPDAYEYFVDIALENLIFRHSMVPPGTSNCECVSNLWLLIIRYCEKFLSGWFKYLHGKMTKLSILKRRFIFEPRSLERLRPDFNLLDSDCTGCVENRPFSLWSIYWSLLAYTAPLHRTYINFSSQSEASTEQLQKYSIVIWLIRKQFLGEPVASDVELGLAIDCLLRLVDVWGPNIEVIRSLWLHFGRKLDQGPGITFSNPEISNFADWLAKIQRSSTTELNSFELFSLLMRTVHHTDMIELNTILKICLPTLTRQAVSCFFLLLGHLFDACLSKWTGDDATHSRTFTILVDFLLATFPDLASPNEFKNWDTGRRCSVLHHLQYLLLLCRDHWTSRCYRVSPLEDSTIYNGFQRLIALVRSLRCTLADIGSFVSECPGVTGRSRLSVGWRLEVNTSAVQFGLCLLEMPEGALDVARTHHTFLANCLDSTFFKSVGWFEQDCWFAFLKQLLVSVSRESPKSLAVNSIRSLIWTEIYPQFKSRVERQPHKATIPSQRVLSELVSLSLEFLFLSCAEYSVQTTNVGCGIPNPLHLLELFSLDRTTNYGVRFTFIDTVFGSPNLLESLVPALVATMADSTEDVAWRFLIIWLAYSLFVRPTFEDRAQGHLNSFNHLSAVGSSLSAHFPTEVAGLFGDTDPELTLINIGARFDRFSTFHSRMAYKSCVGSHLGRLCAALCDCFSVSSSTQENNTGLDHCVICGTTMDTMCSVGYRAVSLLVRHCAPLLYSPVTSGSSLSPLEQLVDNFILPRQLYEWEKLQKHAGSADHSPLSNLVIECMRDKLPDFLSGFGQLTWRSDAYISRIVRDMIRLYYAYLGSECIASAVLSSPALEFREHLLQLAMREAETELQPPHSVHQRRRRLAKWIALCKLVRENSHTVEVSRRDGVYLVQPLLFVTREMEDKDWLTTQLRADCHVILSEYEQAVSLSKPSAPK